MTVRYLLLVIVCSLAACSSSTDPSDTNLPPQPDDGAPINADEQYLIDNAAQDNVLVTDSGLQYEVLRESEGPMPSVESIVTVQYTGTLVDGTEFDSSYARGEPNTFPLRGTIEGWVEGLQLMSVGSHYRFVMPSDLAFGDRGAGEDIKPGATLIFEVELLEINSI